MKTLRKTISLLAVCLILLLSACSQDPLIMPTGYELTQSLVGNKYALVFPDGSLGANVFNSKAEAVGHAIRWEKTKNEPWVSPASKYKWDFDR